MNLKKILIVSFFVLLPLILPPQAQATACSFPVSGHGTVSSSCALTADSVMGVDKADNDETSTANDAVLTVSNADLTIPSGVGGTTTLATGSIVISGTSTIIIGSSNSQIKLGTPIYVSDADADGWSTDTNYYTATASGRRRRSLMHGLTVDCDDTTISTTNTCGVLAKGDGADGAFNPDGAFNLNTAASGERSYADGIAYKLSANPNGTTLTTVDTPSGLAAGDEILLINLQGSSTDFADVGNYESLEVASIDGSTITTVTDIQNSYDGTDFANQKVIIQRVPNYTNLTLDNTDSLTASAWDGLTTTPTGAAGYSTGIVAFKATGTVTVNSGTTIDVAGLGYRKGIYDAASGAGTGGESISGPGGIANGNGAAGGGSTPNNPGGNGYSGGGGGAVGVNGISGGTGSVTSGGSGGGGGRGAVGGDDRGYGGCGGGGGYGTAGERGYASGGMVVGNAQNGGTNSSGDGGDGSNGNAGGGGGGGTYGDAPLASLFLGSGGGGGGRGMRITTKRDGNDGANGAGIIYIGANTITIEGTIQANGNNGLDPLEYFGGSGGGGGGGSIKLYGDTVTLGADLVTASAGSGGNTADLGISGNGGVGRIAIEYITTLSGTTSPSANTTQVSP